MIHDYRRFEIIKCYDFLLNNNLTSPEILYLPAFQGSEKALSNLFHIYRLTKDPKVQKEMLSFLKTCADNGFNHAVELLFFAYTRGFFGLDPKNPEVQKNRVSIN